jgi:NAD(P)-dependent dehydrogenase (short-subunit alcohol dehydrogenase family)
MRMKDRVAIVTGGGRGICREIALTFAREGAKLAILDLNQENLDQASKEIEALGREVIASRIDASDRVEVSGFVGTVADRFGRIDILVNCAAYIVYGPFLEFDEEVWRQMLDVNLTGYFLCSQAAAREMVKNRRGRVINIASVAADFGVDRGVAYCASKAGVLGLTRVMALELAPYGINVNAIAPGPVDTEQLRGLLTDEEIQLRARVVPLKRFASPAEIARAAVFLASEDSDYINGEVLRVDGGLSGTRTG